MSDLLKGLKILVVDDEKLVRETLIEQLQMHDIICDESSNGLDAFDKVKSNNYDFIITDVRMPEASGIDLLNMIKSYDQKTPEVIMMSAFSDISQSRAKEMGAPLGLYLKPQQISNLLELIEDSL